MTNLNEFSVVRVFTWQAALLLLGTAGSHWAWAEDARPMNPCPETQVLFLEVADPQEDASATCSFEVLRFDWWDLLPMDGGTSVAIEIDCADQAIFRHQGRSYLPAALTYQYVRCWRSESRCGQSILGLDHHCVPVVRKLSHAAP